MSNALQKFCDVWNNEAARTSKAVKAIPETRYGWSPHEKSMTAGELAQHTIRAEIWFASISARGEMFPMNTLGCPEQPKDKVGADALLKWYDRERAKAIDALGANEKQLGGTLDFYGHPWNRTDMLWEAVLHHTIHHRGQLTVYLRLLGAPVPSIYGPSADEGTFPKK